MCVTLTVPLDHFDPTDTRTIDVVFAVRPATGRSKGLFVTATGGPGTAGISSADSYTSVFEESIRRRFDIVFFDQRGIGLPGGLTCPAAAAVYYVSTEPPIDAASRFSVDCVAEMGSPPILPYVGTEQAIEDFELFREALGEPRVWLYGESYGTQYAQEYAAAHGDALEGLILDGTVDLAATGPDVWHDWALSFERVLGETLASCDRRPRCHADAGGSAGAVYDALIRRLDDGPVRVRFPLPSGDTAMRELTRAGLDLLASGQLYGETHRMLLQRALAAAGRGEVVPLVRLVYSNLYVDPMTLEPILDPTLSDAMYYGVECQDYGTYAGTLEEQARHFTDEARAVATEFPRLGSGIFLGDLPCVFWPGATQDLSRPAPLRAEGVTTLVLGSTGDPITSINQGESVFEDLADGYLVTQRGGPHVIFGRGIPCQDGIVTRFLVDGKPPAHRRTTCPGELVSAYVPLAPTSASLFATPKAVLVSAENEISYLPEYYYWDGLGTLSVGCPFGGGKIRFDETAAGATMTLWSCAFSRGLRLTGSGSIDYGEDRVVLDVQAEGRFNGRFRYVSHGESATVARS